MSNDVIDKHLVHKFNANHSKMLNIKDDILMNTLYDI